MYEVDKRIMKDKKTGKVWQSKSYWMLGTEKGHRFDQSLHTTVKKVADERARQIYRDVINSDFGIVTPQKITLSQLMERYLDYCRIGNTNSANTVHKKQFMVNAILEYFKGSKLISQITQGDIELFMQERAKQVSHSTVNHDLTVLKHALKLAVQWGLLPKSPAQFVKKYRVNNEKNRALTKDEYERLLSFCNPSTRFAVVVALLSGMRLGEMLSLTWEYIDLENRRITLLHTKNGEVRKIPIIKELYDELMEIDPKEGNLIQSPRRLRKGFEAAVQCAELNVDREGNPIRPGDLNRFTWHSLRHTCATWLLMKGVPPTTVMEIMGWKTMAMLPRYNNPHDDYLALEMQKLTQ